jgi:ribose-phosphate pyrophosphokinase
MSGDILLLATRNYKSMASRVAYHLKTFPEYYTSGNGNNIHGTLNTTKFADGEMEVELLSSLRGKDVFLIGGSGQNPSNISVEESKQELYHSIDAIKRSAPRRITLIEPYCSSSRSDRTTRRNSVGFWIHYKMMVSLGLNHLITFQLHSDKSKTVVDPTVCAIDDVPVSTLIMEYLTESFIGSEDKLKEVQNNWVFCSVDAGGENLSRKYSQAFGIPLIIAHKQRDYHKVNTVTKVNILSDTDIAGKSVWIVDDMIDTGGSLVTLIKELVKRSVKSINVAVIHPVFSHPAIERLQELREQGQLDNLVVCDTLNSAESLKNDLPFIHAVSIERLLAELIMQTNQDGSLSPFFEDFNIAEYFRKLEQLRVSS